MANSLPMTLRVYRKLSFAVVPLAPALIKRRLKLGKEDPARVGERRGVSNDVRPRGPLIWIYGASVGEVLAAAALIEKLRALNIRILLTSGTVTSAAIVARRFPPDIIHQYVPYDLPRFVARFLDHWRPSLALFIESDLWPNLILSSAARRLPMVLINGRMSHRSFPRWRRVYATISALLGKFDVCLAQSEVDAARFTALGSRNVVTTGNLKLDVSAPPADPAEARAVDVGHARPPDRRGGVHPSRRRGNPARGAPDAEGTFSLAADRDRAPASRSRGGDCADDRGLRPEGGLAFARGPADGGDRHLCRRHARRTGPVLPSGAESCSWADRWSNMADRIRSRRSSSVRSIVHGPHVFNFTDVYEALDSAGGARRAETQEALVKQLGQLLADPAARDSQIRAAERVVEQLGGALERTLAALEPYLLQLRLEMGAAMREPAFWYRPPSWKSHLLRPLGALYGAIAARRLQR